MGMFGSVPDSKPRENPEEGKYDARLYLIADLGTSKDEFKGEVKYKRKLYLAWELVGTKMSDGRPFVIGKEYGVSSSKFDKGFYFPPQSNIHKMLKVWTGADEKKCKSAAFLEALLDEGVPATITVEHQQGKKDPAKTYAVIESVKPYKGKDKLGLENAPVKYILGADTFGDLPEWIQKKVSSCLENTDPSALSALNQAPEEPKYWTSDHPGGELVPF